MKIFLGLVLNLIFNVAFAQNPTAAYVKALYKRYPTEKSSLCPACKLWINPYYKSIADTQRHVPIVTFYVYTKAHKIEQERINLPRTGIFAAWHPAAGQLNETSLYKLANHQSTAMIAKGHCQAWILLAWCADAAILSDTYTFNAGMEYQGQNVGTEIATEERCRKLIGLTDSIRIWCGTSGQTKTYIQGNLTATVPSHYYKIMQYRTNTGQFVTECYWLPNLPEENRSLLPQRTVSHDRLVTNLGYDPLLVLD